MGDKNWKAFERHVGQVLFDGSKRNMGSGAINKRDDGEDRTGDVINDTWEIECKVYQKIGIFRWWDKLAKEATASHKIPVLVTREKGDLKDTLVTIHWTQFVEMKKCWEQGRELKCDEPRADS